MNKIEIHSCAVEKDTMSFPLGALCIKTAINEKGTIPQAVVSEHFVSDDAYAEAELCIARMPAAVGVSVYIWNAKWFEDFCRQLKKINPYILIFAGGPQIVAFKGVVPDYIDFAVQGEGEISTVSFLEAYFLGTKEIPSCKSVVNGIISDTNALSSVFLSHNADCCLENTDSILWEMTRGCPYGCAFCYESRGNHTVRNFPFERISDELDYIISSNIRNIFVLDPTFNLSRQRSKQILKLLIEKCPSYIHFTFEIRAELVDDELAQLFSCLNCSLQIGLQSCNSNVLKNIGRSFDLCDFESKTKLLCKYGVTFGIDIIIGLPGDSLSSFKKTVDFAVSLQPSNIDCFLLSVLPGTTLENIAPEFGIVCSEENNNVLFTRDMRSTDIENAVEIKKAMDLFYTKGQSCMWIHCVLETLNITACNLFALFNKWINQTGRCEDEDIWLLQDDFIRSLFEKTRNNKLIPAIKSFMELHQGICFVTDTGECAPIDLSYTPDELSSLDSISLSEFVKTYKMRHFSAVLSLDDDGSVVYR